MVFSAARTTGDMTVMQSWNKMGYFIYDHSKSHHSMPSTSRYVTPATCSLWISALELPIPAQSLPIVTVRISVRVFLNLVQIIGRKTEFVFVFSLQKLLYYSKLNSYSLLVTLMLIVYLFLVSHLSESTGFPLL